MFTPHQTVARFVFSILTLFGFGGIGLLPAADDVGTPATAAVASSAPIVTATGFGPEQHALIDWAVDLFRQADLPLPPVDFIHEPSRDPCKGRRGSHMVDQGRSIIRICTDDAGLADQIL